MKKTKNNLYKTGNFYLSAYLTKGFEISELEPSPSNSGKSAFCLFNDEELQKELSSFFNYRAVVKSQNYNSALKNLRSLI